MRYVFRTPHPDFVEQFQVSVAVKAVKRNFPLEIERGSDFLVFSCRRQIGKSLFFCMVTHIGCNDDRKINGNFLVVDT